MPKSDKPTSKTTKKPAAKRAKAAPKVSEPLATAGEQPVSKPSASNPAVSSSPKPPEMPSRVASAPAPPSVESRERRDRAQPYPDRKRDEMTMHPRKVRYGVKLADRSGELPEHWATQRWMRLLEQGASGPVMTEAKEYAKIGQTRRLDIASGVFEGPVQGRRRSSYTTAIKLDAFTADQWTAVVEAMADQSIYTAKMLSGELPQNVEDLFAPFGLHLFPTELGQLRASCSCGHDSPWCKHTVCLGLLIADRLATEPFLIFTLRGMPGDDLIERLRQHRQATSGSMVGQAAAVYTPHLGAEVRPLDADLAQFWHASDELDEVDAPIAPPEVSHPLLRRLGPSPFEASRFPFVGLLATCYDVISRAALLSDPDAAEGLERAEAAPVEPATRPLPGRKSLKLGKAKAFKKDD